MLVNTQIQESPLRDLDVFQGEVDGTLLKKIFNLFTFRERGKEGERKGEKHRYVRDTWIGCLSKTPNPGPGLQPRHMP